jgi:hypothetical protein
VNFCTLILLQDFSLHLLRIHRLKPLQRPPEKKKVVRKGIRKEGTSGKERIDGSEESLDESEESEEREQDSEQCIDGSEEMKEQCKEGKEERGVSR